MNRPCLSYPDLTKKFTTLRDLNHFLLCGGDTSDDDNIPLTNLKHSHTLSVMQKSLKDKIALNLSKQGDDEGEDELQMDDKKRCKHRKNVITKLDSFLMSPRISNKVAKMIRPCRNN